MVDSANGILRRIRQRSPAGFAIALHITYTTPKYLFQAYDLDWLNHYSSQGYVMNDPTVRWGFANTGAIRWSVLAADDPTGVLEDAAAHGLRYGLTVSVFAESSRSIASFARGDREMTDLDIAALGADAADLHGITAAAQFVTPELHRTLKQLSIFLTHS